MAWRSAHVCSAERPRTVAASGTFARSSQGRAVEADDSEAEEKAEEEEEQKEGEEEEEDDTSDAVRALFFEDSDSDSEASDAEFYHRPTCDGDIQLLGPSQEEKDRALLWATSVHVARGTEAEWRAVRSTFHTNTGIVRSLPELQERVTHLYRSFLDVQSPQYAELAWPVRLLLESFHAKHQRREDELLLEVLLDKRMFHPVVCYVNQWDPVADAFNAQLGPPSPRKGGKALRARVKHLYRVYRCEQSHALRSDELSPYLRDLLEQYDAFKLRTRKRGRRNRDADRARHPQVGTLDLEKDTTMVRAFLDGAFCIRQSTSRIHELHNVVATSRGSDWTAQDVDDQLEFLSKAASDYRHVAHKEVTSHKLLHNMLRDLDKCRTHLRPYLAIANQGNSRDRCFDDLLLEEVAQNPPFHEPSHQQESEVWGEIAARLNRLLETKVLFTGASCAARFSLLRDVQLGNVTSSVVDLTPAQRAWLNSIDVVDVRTNIEARRETMATTHVGSQSSHSRAGDFRSFRRGGDGNRGPHAMPAATPTASEAVVPPRSCSPSQLAMAVLESEERMRQYVDEKLRNLISETDVNKNLDAQARNTDSKIKRVEQQFQTALDQVKVATLAVQTDLASEKRTRKKKDKAEELARKSHEVNVAQRFAIAAQAFGDARPSHVDSVQAVPSIVSPVAATTSGTDVRPSDGNITHRSKRSRTEY